MKEYTKRDQSRYGDMDIAKVAYPKFQEKLQVCKDLLHGFDFSGFIGGSPLVMAKLVTGGVNFCAGCKSIQAQGLVSEGGNVAEAVALLVFQHDHGTGTSRSRLYGGRAFYRGENHLWWEWR